jgi:putative dimethyl sulfoxide reductase chaperone
MDTVLFRQEKLQDAGQPDQQNEFSAAATVRASMFDFLATLLNQRPDLELVRKLRSSSLEVLISQAEVSEPGSQVVLGLREMARFIESTSRDPETEVETALGVDWTRLFRGVTPRYGPPPPYESIYADTGETDLGTIKSLIEFYWTSGAQLENTAGNRPDYLGLELSFLCFLAEEEAKAWESGNEELARSYQEKASSFFEQHPAAWANKFLIEALNYAKTGFYKGYLYLCQGTISQGGKQDPGSGRKEARTNN